MSLVSQSKFLLGDMPDVEYPRSLAKAIFSESTEKGMTSRSKSSKALEGECCAFIAANSLSSFLKCGPRAFFKVFLRAKAQL